MDFYLQKARVFATETAKKSQEIANQAAKLSQSLAVETSKRSKELAVDIAKKADQLKTFAGDLTPSNTTRGPGGLLDSHSQEELNEFGIIPELREYVEGLTMKTFTDFPLKAAGEGGVDESGKKDLTPWRERHAALVLLTVRKIADFRYVLCPRRMNESRFWTIYFTLVHPQIKEYEERALAKATLVASEEEIEPFGHGDGGSMEYGGRARETSAAHPGQERLEVKQSSSAVESKKATNDLDDYFMGSLDNSDDEVDGEDDIGFDADFDQYINSTADSDGEDESSPGPINTSNTGINKPVAASGISSDGEIVEVPTSDSEAASQVGGEEGTKL